MSRETVPASSQPISSSVCNQDGSLNEANLTRMYGLGIKEAMQEVRFGNYTGTVAQMLDDVRCPVGETMRAAYQQKGIDGVIGAFEGLRMMAPGFKVDITEETLQREREKKI